MISDRAVCWSVIALAGIVASFGGCEARAQYPRAEFELMQGKTKFHAREDGTWFQSAHQTNNSLESSSYLLGLKLYANEGWGLRVGYTRLGDFKGDNWASVRDQDAQHSLSPSTCDPGTGRDCLALYTGRGHAQGLYYGPFVERSFGQARGLLELGFFSFRSNYDVTVLHPYDDVFTPRGNSYEYNHATGEHTTWYVGLGASYPFFKGASLAILARAYKNVFEQGDHACPAGGAQPGQVCGDVGLTGGWTRQVLAGVQVPF